MRILPANPILICLLSLAWPLMSHADIAVIVNSENPLHAMLPRQVSDLYLGRARNFVTEAQKTPLRATVYEQPAESPLREAFFRALNGMSMNQVNAYWARLRFSGEVLPPAVLADSHVVLEAVKRDRTAIGYVDSAVVDDSVKVVLRLKE